MGKFIKLRPVSIAEQIFKLKNNHPHFTSAFTSHSSMKVIGTLQPTPRSDIYTFVLKYSLTNNPVVKITSPQLKKNNNDDAIPHLYPDGSLCLFRPAYEEFKESDFISDTIIPWISLWLYFYEVWHLTGEWRGGGEHPTHLSPRINISH